MCLWRTSCCGCDTESVIQRKRERERERERETGKKVSILGQNEYLTRAEKF